MIEHPCKTCLYFAALTKRCQRFPPTVVQQRGIMGVKVTVWPRVNENDGCGEYHPAQEPSR